MRAGRYRQLRKRIERRVRYLFRVDFPPDDLCEMGVVHPSLECFLVGKQLGMEKVLEHPPTLISQGRGRVSCGKSCLSFCMIGNHDASISLDLHPKRC